MEYLSRDELVRLFKVARSHNPPTWAPFVRDAGDPWARHLRRQAVSQATEEEPPDSAHSAN